MASSAVCHVYHAGTMALIVRQVVSKHTFYQPSKVFLIFDMASFWFGLVLLYTIIRFEQN